MDPLGSKIQQTPRTSFSPSSSLQSRPACSKETTSSVLVVRVRACWTIWNGILFAYSNSKVVGIRKKVGWLEFVVVGIWCIDHTQQATTIYKYSTVAATDLISKEDQQ